MLDARGQPQLDFDKLPPELGKLIQAPKAP